MTYKASERRSASVLIVDRSEESRDVLRTVLENRGVNILEAKQGAEGLELLREQQPSVVVLDLEVDASDADEMQRKLQDAFEDESRRNEIPLVLLGKIRGTNRSIRRDGSTGAKHIIAKPYHYAPLIRTIEQLLDEHQAVR